ncbi:MAG: phytanoyl-CoA dioxygenase family protein [Halobacteriaceae archaeon]
MPVLTTDDRRSFERDGYVKLSGVVPEEHCEAVVDAVWDCLGQDPDDPETWYDPPAGLDDHWDSRPGGFVKLFHHQALWDVRQHPRVYQAFAELLGEERLWTTIDQTGMKPPRHPDHPELDREFVHVDVDCRDVPRPVPRPYGLQGVVYLADTTEEHGGFHCVPSLYRRRREWLDGHDGEGRHPDLLGPDGGYADSPLDPGDVEAVPGEAGDLVVWDRLLPHGNGVNRTDEPRFAQYVAMEPARFGDHEARAARVASWREQRPYFDHQTPDPREWERRNCERADLTPLGRRLLGADPWEGWLSMADDYDYPAFT